MQEYTLVLPLKKLSETPPLEHVMSNNHAEEKADKTWLTLTPHEQIANIVHVEVYLHNFIGVV